MALRQLLASVSTNVTTSAIQLKNQGHPAVHLVTLMVSGTFGGAKVKAQIGVSNSTDGASWVTFTDGTFAAASAANFEVGEGALFRVITSAASAGTTNLNCWAAIGRSTR